MLTDPQKTYEQEQRELPALPAECFYIPLSLTVLPEDLPQALSSTGKDTEGIRRGHERDTGNDPMSAAFSTWRCAHFITTVVGINKG